MSEGEGMGQQGQPGEQQPQQQQSQESGAALGLGIAGLVIGIVALLFSFIPCLGAFAVWPGILAVVLAGVGLGLSLKAGKVSGLSIAGLSVAVVACGIAIFQYYALKKGAEEVEKAGRKFMEDVEEHQRKQREKQKQNQN